VIDAIRELGLYDLISQPSATCLFNPQYPETHAKLKEVLLSENMISLKDLIKRSIKNAEILNL